MSASSEVSGPGTGGERGSAGSTRPPVYIITGEQGEGKTTFLTEILTILGREALCIRGIIAPGYVTDGLRSGFSLTDLGRGISEELSSTTPAPGGTYLGRYYFRPEGIAFGERAILTPHDDTKTDLLVIDEVGRFDVQGSLWGPCIDRLEETMNPPMIWTVRREFVPLVTSRWPRFPPVIIELKTRSAASVAGEILREIKRRAGTKEDS